ncbi:MAG: transcriptional repressor LexA [Melioribacteraceae bacterium]|nr:MAG: transcriptional repressor LexA [Melioribacteraceae bacterium]
MKLKLTDRQQDILNFIQQYLDTNGYPPTLREIGKKFDISSTFGVKRHLEALVKKGYLNIESHQSRALSIVDSVASKVQQIAEKLIEIPVVGRVAAGYPILAEENIENTLVVDPSFVQNNPNCFGLKVRGDSMINAGIFEGDTVIVNPQKDASNGEIVVALLGDEATLKRFEKKNNYINLIPENEKYQTITLTNREDFSIIGKVVGVFRLYN